MTDVTALTSNEVAITSDDSALTVLQEIQQKLAGIATVGDAKEVADQAAALQRYAKRAQKGLGVQNHCAWVKLIAERRAGELLCEMDMLRRGGLIGRDAFRSDCAEASQESAPDTNSGMRAPSLTRALQTAPCR